MTFTDTDLQILAKYLDDASSLIAGARKMLRGDSWQNKDVPADACPCGSGKRFKDCHGIENAKAETEINTATAEDLRVCVLSSEESGYSVDTTAGMGEERPCVTTGGDHEG